MPAVSAPPRRPATAVWRLLTLLAVVGQLLSASAAWLDFSSGGRDQRAHVESAGTQLHFVHDDAECALCALMHLGGIPGQARNGPAGARAHATVPPESRSAAVVAEHVRTSRSRAPPDRA